MQVNPVLVAVNPLKRKFKQLERIPIEHEEFTIGRRSKCSAVIRDYDGISRRHCVIKKLNRTEWEVEVLSTRKIRVNRKKLKKGKVYKLKHDDIIQLDDAGDFVYKFINNEHVEVDCDRPPKRRRYNNEVPNDVRNNSQIASNENGQDTNRPETSNRQSDSRNASSWTEKDMAKRVQDLVSNFAVQIEKLKGEGSQTRQQRVNDRNAQLSVVKRQMEDKICAEIMGPLKEISKLKDNLLKKQEEFIEKLNSHESSKHKLQQELQAKIQEHAQDQTEKKKLTLDLEEVNSQLKSVETEKEALEKINTVAKHATLTELSETMENELQCIICAGMFVGATTLGCSHMFCEFCIGQWKKKKNECPLCRTTIGSECKSLVLDSFITKMVENLTDDMKKKREEMLKERADQVTAALLNPEADRESEGSDGFDINDFILDEEENEENINEIISMRFGSDSFDSGNDSEESPAISDYNSDDSHIMSDFANEESHDSDFNSEDVRMEDDFPNEDSHHSDINSDDSNMMSDFAREDTPDIFDSQHSNDVDFGSGFEDEGDEFNGSDDEQEGSQHSNDDQDMNSNGSGYEDDASQHSNDEHDGSYHSDDQHDGSQHSDDENEGSQSDAEQRSDDEHDDSQRSDDDYDGSQHSDDENDESQRSDDEQGGSQHSDDEHDGSQHSDDEHDGSQHSEDEHDNSHDDEHDGSQSSDDEHDGSQRSDDEHDGCQRSDDDGSQNSNDEYDGSQHSDGDHDGGNEYNEMEVGDEYSNSGRGDDDQYSHDEEGEQQSNDEYESSQHSNDPDSNDDDQYSNDEQSGNESSNDGYEDGGEYHSIGRHRYYNLPNHYGGRHY